MYIAILVTLLIFTLISFITKKHNILYFFSMVALTLLLCFRYGQGTDYFGYQYFFNIFSTFEEAINNSREVNCEIGYRFICAFFGMLKFDFTAFIFCISVFQMLMLNRFLKKFSPNKIFSLLLFFPTCYLTYFFSGIRQGLTLAIFIGILVPYIDKGKWNRYLLGCVILSFIHTAALILLIVPLVLQFNLKSVYAISIASVTVGCILATGVANGFIAMIPVIGPKMLPYLTNSISIFGTLERVISFALIAILYETSQKSERITKFMKIYAVGVSIYLLFLAFSLISSRVIVYFKILEVILIPMMVKKPSKFRQLICAFFILLALVLSIKNLDSYVQQGNYDEELNAFTYPYVSIFEKEKIHEYRQVDTYYYDMK